MLHCPFCQIEYANKAVENSGTCLGIRGKVNLQSSIFDNLMRTSLFRMGWCLPARRLSHQSCTRLAPTGGSPTSTLTLEWPPQDSSQTLGSLRRLPGLFLLLKMLFQNRCQNRDEAATYRSDYGSPIPLPHLVQRVSSYMHAYTLYSSIR